MASVDTVLALLRGVAGLPRPALAVLVLLLLLLLLRGTARRRRRRPRPGEVWFAEVAFEEGRGSKDRPVLVLAVDGRTVSAAPFTSQDKSARRDHRRVPDGVAGLRRASWVDLEPVRLRRSALRRRAGAPGDGLVRWYEAERAAHAARPGR